MVDRSTSSETARATRKRDVPASNESTVAENPILDLQRQAGNRAVAELLQGDPGSGPTDPSPALRLRDALRAGRGPIQRELSLDVSRDAKDDAEAKTAAEAKSLAESKSLDEAKSQAEQKVERLLRFGSRGPDVAEIQAMLGLTADGRFGAKTRAAVVAFQRSAELDPDGIVGPLTRGALRAREGDTAKLAEKLPDSTEKVPGEEELAGQPKELPNSTEKLPTSTEKVPSSTEKGPFEEKFA